jgi:transcription initiation factor TFIIH subunit 1
MKSCQIATNEFLRQYWSSVYPPAAESQTIMIAAPAQRAAKATKMISYIVQTPEKVNVMKRLAEQSGIDPTRIETVTIAYLSSLSLSILPIGHETSFDRC